MGAFWAVLVSGSVGAFAEGTLRGNMVTGQEHSAGGCQWTVAVA
jgi:hypothetical protein